MESNLYEIFMSIETTEPYEYKVMADSSDEAVNKAIMSGYFFDIFNELIDSNKECKLCHLRIKKRNATEHFVSKHDVEDYYGLVKDKLGARLILISRL